MLEVSLRHHTLCRRDIQEDVHWDTTMKIWNTLITVWICVIHESFQDTGGLVLTSAPLTATNRDLITLICEVPSGNVAVAWLQNNTSKVITQNSNNCTKQPPLPWDNISRFNVSCNDTVHSIQFTFNSTTDQGGWQCGNSVNDTYTYPRSKIYTIVSGVAGHVMSTQSSSTTWHTKTASEPVTVTSQKGVTSPVTSTQSSSTTNRYTETTSEPGIMTSHTGPVMSTQVLPPATRYTETTLETETVTPQKASTDDSDSNTIYIVVGAVGGAVLLAVVVVGIVCIRQRRQAAFAPKYQKEEVKGERKVTGAQVYQNAASCDMVENELYRRSSDITPLNEAENQDDSFILSDAYASVNMGASSTSTPREQGASCDVDVDSLYAKPDKSRSSNGQQVSDIYAEVKKPKKKRPDNRKASEDVNTGDVYAKPNKR